MKTLPQFLCLLAAFTFATGSSLRAQYNPPPPPDQQQAAPDQDQGAPPPDQQPTMGQDQGAPPPDQAPMGQDQGAPPPGDQQAPPPDDQGAPPPDDGSASNDASGDANFQTFYNDLSSQGTWVQTDNYGYAWQPDVQDPDWAPYQNGHWVYTDEGWTWVADASEPWGWATYHYGRWVNIDGEGWVWVPGYTWAPAWVSWRYGGGYCGWAPLPPDTFVGIDFGGTGFGFHIGGDCDTAYGIGPGYYNFLPIGFLGERNYRGHYRNRNDNFALIGNTRNVTNIVVNNQRGSGRFGRVTAGGPNFATVNAQSHTPVQRAQLTHSNRVGAASLSGNRLAVFAPRVNAAAAGTSFRPRTVGGTLANAQINRGTNISDPLVVNSRLRPTAASAQQVEAARTAESHVASSAHIATASTRPTQELSRPLTSYTPHSSARTAGTVHTATPGVAAHTQSHTSSTVDRAFTGEATGAPVSETEARREAAARTQASTGAVQSHTEIHSNANNDAEAERAQRQQTEHAQAEREQSQRAEGDREAQRTQTEHAQADRAPVQHDAVEHAPVEHAAVSHAEAPAPHPAAAPQQHAAPHPSGGGGGGGNHGDNHGAPAGNDPNHK